ncbi:HAD family hydrolase [Catenovulum adriaticum]|uniref:HAD family hydrolase n=1 Tax=Catenovulum adriaticum TaxID=2984846 RepID=A0ABY7AU91_9ALTE|nr:HAD family hydrolase [Catenovulum sp. TS8]WAJ72211.1 HAD family hydrolase [Catenovulum sp. TS8]
MNNNIDLIIFDCDGVLIDSEIISATVLIDKLLTVGITIDIDYVQRHFLGCSFSSVKDMIHDQFNVTLANSFEYEYRIALLEEFDKSLQTTEGIKTILNQLTVPFCLATSSSPKRTETALNIVGLTSYFSQRIFTAAEVINGKPAPDLFLHAANKMKVKPENCLVIEDSMAGVTAALAAGMKVIHYKGGLHMSDEEHAVSKAYPEVEVMRHWNEFTKLQPTLSN